MEKYTKKELLEEKTRLLEFIKEEAKLGKFHLSIEYDLMYIEEELEKITTNTVIGYEV